MTRRCASAGIQATDGSGVQTEAVSYYQLHNLPCPVLKDQRMQDHDRLRDVGIDREAGLIGSQSVQRFPHKRK